MRNGQVKGCLPTEAKWEYAACGGLIGKRDPWGDAITHYDANYDGTGGRGKWGREETAPLGSFEPNGYGLYDMVGNVSEWCADWYGLDYYSKSLAKKWWNLPGPRTGIRRVYRGGVWSYTRFRCVVGWE